MPPAWDAEQQRTAKELLYRCLEELQSTKAAIYLESDAGDFRLATSYGFGRRDLVPESLGLGHPLMDWVRRRRTAPAYLNELQEFPPLHAHLEGAGTSRLLTIPLALGDRLVGLVDVRDKSRKARFGPEDVAVAKSIRSAIERFLSQTGGYGDLTPPPEEAQAAPIAPPKPAAATPAQAPGPTLPHRWVIEELTGVVRPLARLPEIAAAALTLTDGSSARALVLRASPFDELQRDALAVHQTDALHAAGIRMPPPERWGWDEQASGGTQTRREEIRTAVLLAGPPVWIALSLVTPAGSTAGDPVFAAARRHLELAALVSDYRRAARNLARILLEPGETSYPHLRQHCQSTSEIAQRMAAALRLSPDQEELITVAAYLHDIGMRELEYARVYRMETPGDTERRIYQRHPVLGARIVEGAEFPGDLAGAIRHHHERWDGTGYPSRLAGNLIPFPSRVIHLAEVYDVLTSTSSYRRQLTRDAAVETIRAEAGRQFDPELVHVLVEVVRP